MGVTFTNRFNPKEKAAKIIHNTARNLERELEYSITEIQQRTQRGVDADGGAFKGYTKEYAKFKGSDQVNLTLSGGMLGAVRSKVEILGNIIRGTIYLLGTSSAYRRGKKVYSAKNQDKALWTQSGPKARRWLQFSESQYRRIKTAMKNLLK